MSKGTGRSKIAYHDAEGRRLPLSKVFEKKKPRMVNMTPEEQQIFQRVWKRVRRTIRGGLVNQIHCHGPIDTGHIPSTLKRVVGQLRDPFYELANAFIEEKRKAEAEKEALEDEKYEREIRDVYLND